LVIRGSRAYLPLDRPRCATPERSGAGIIEPVSGSKGVNPVISNEPDRSAANNRAEHRSRSPRRGPQQPGQVGRLGHRKAEEAK
jgi:hypothetical protein